MNTQQVHQVHAISYGVTISPRKARLIADALRGKSVSMGMRAVLLLEKRAATLIGKVLKSAVANAKGKQMNEEALYISQLEVMGGPAQKRFHPSTRGRVHPYKKRTSHIKIVLEEKGGESK